LPHSAAFLGHSSAAASVSIIAMASDLFQLDPSRFLQRIDLELSEEAMDHLEHLSSKTGRSIRDLAADLLSQACADQEQLQG